MKTGRATCFGQVEIPGSASTLVILGNFMGYLPRKGEQWFVADADPAAPDAAPEDSPIDALFRGMTEEEFERMAGTDEPTEAERCAAARERIGGALVGIVERLYPEEARRFHVVINMHGSWHHYYAATEVAALEAAADALDDSKQ